MTSRAENQALAERVQRLEEQVDELRAATPAARKRRRGCAKPPDEKPTKEALALARRTCRDFGLRKARKR